MSLSRVFLVIFIKNQSRSNRREQQVSSPLVSASYDSTAVHVRTSHFPSVHSGGCSESLFSPNFEHHATEHSVRFDQHIAPSSCIEKSEDDEIRPRGVRLRGALQISFFICPLRYSLFSFFFFVNRDCDSSICCFWC